MWLGYTLTGYLAGTISGMGIGGGALLIPALGIFFGMNQQAAQSINLLYFIPTAIIAVITHQRKGNIDPKGLLKLVVFGLIGAAIGATIAMWVNANSLRTIFGIFLLTMGVMEILKKGKTKNGSTDI
ncbi:MAG: sulfite exporter TauE/SafE family protein [Defluviitaleaceae bacterium]|nr:sulfite exporter TauE/SafE family protein [Defluviitaleaceae bacterium]